MRQYTGCQYRVRIELLYVGNPDAAWPDRRKDGRTTELYGPYSLPGVAKAVLTRRRRELESRRRQAPVPELQRYGWAEVRIEEAVIEKAETTWTAVEP